MAEQARVRPQASNGKHLRISLSILKLLQAARQTYGLRTNDYARYHSHCVRRLQTLHKATGLVSRPPRKAGKGTNAAKPKFTSATAKIDAAAVRKDERVLELLLWEAERAWSEGMRTREEVAALERKASATVGPLSKKRHRSHRRLQKAAQHANTLVQLLRELSTTTSDAATPATASSHLQASIYALYLLGTAAFSQAASPASASSTASRTGAEALSTAYVLLESMAASSSHATEEALAFEMLDELEPMIRFCAYKADISAGANREASTADLARQIGQPLVERQAEYSGLRQNYQSEEQSAGGKAKQKSSEEAVKAIVWRDLDVPVRSAELSTGLAKVNTILRLLESKTSGTSKRTRKDDKADIATRSIGTSERAMASYDRALAALSEAEERSRKLVEDNATALSKAHSARFEAASRPLGIAHSYVVFQLLSLRIRRDEALLASTLAKLAHREAKASSASAQVSARRVASNGPLPLPVKRKRVKAFPAAVKLLDGMLQSLEQLRELDIVEEDSAGLADTVEAKIAFDKARRCLYLGQTYALLEKFPEALSLLQRAGLYVRQVSSATAHLADDGLGDTAEDAKSTSSLGTASLVIDPTVVDELSAALAAAESRAQKDWFTYQYRSKGNEGASKGSAAAGSTELDSAVQALAFDSSSVAIKAKKSKAGPLFFDVAYNYVTGIDMDRIESASKGEDVTMPASYTQPTQIAQGAVEAVKDVVMQSVEQVKESMPDAPDLAPQPDTPSKSAGGIWGFFGRRK